MITLMFDMDGPLTLSKEKIDHEMVDALQSVFGVARLVLVSGASLEQVSRQLGEAIELFTKIYPNCGNGGRPVWTYAREEIEARLDALSAWGGDVQGPRIDWRGGSFNFAACGQNASPELRREYSEWESARGERMRLASELEIAHPELQATIGGRVSIDVTKVGQGKEQVEVDQETIFFCDSLGPHGGDELLARKVQVCGGLVVYSRRPKFTRRFLDLYREQS